MSQVKDDTSFMDAGVLDSFRFLEMVAFLERTFGIQVEDDEMTAENMDSVRKLLTYLEEKQESRTRVNYSFEAGRGI